VVYILTLSKPIVMSVRPWATLLTRTHTRRTEPGRVRLGCGWRGPATCGHECSFIQGVLGLATFWKLFLFFGAKLQASGRSDPRTWTRDDSRTLDFGAIPEYYYSEWSRDNPKHLDVEVFPEHLET